MDKNEFIYRVTRRRNRPVYGAWSPTGQQVKLVTRRSLSGMLKAEGDTRTWTVLKVERARIGEYEDVTSEHVPAMQPGGPGDLWAV